MKTVLIDTNIISLFLHGNPQVVAKVALYLAEYPCLTFSVINYYEIVSGLAHRDAQKQMQSFLAFAEQCEILPLTADVADKTADVYATLRKQGTPVDDIDLLIAARHWHINESSSLIIRNILSAYPILKLRIGQCE